MNSTTDRAVITAAQARHAAGHWVETIGSYVPGFRGAWLAGSLCWLEDRVVLPPWSDADVMVVLEHPAPAKPGKLIHQGILLEITHLPVSAIASAEILLDNYRLVASFANTRLLADPHGILAPLQREVGHEFPRRSRVLNRIAQAETALTAGMSVSQQKPSMAEQAMWVFPAGIVTHLPLVAALENPTVRRRYETVRALLSRHGEMDLYERILEATGYGDIPAAEAERHWRGMVDIFDAASEVTGAPFPFASDISQVARPISVLGTRDMLDRGLHREAMFWIVATWARSLLILRHDHPGNVPHIHERGFESLLAAVGIQDETGLLRRTDALLELLPSVRACAIHIVDTTPAIRP